MTFELSRQRLIEVASACQQRSYSEEIDLLLQQGDTIEWMVKGVGSHEKNGISSDPSSIQSRSNQYGSNEKYNKQPPGFCELFLQALEDFTLRILIVAAIISIILQMSTADADHLSTAWIEGAAVLLAVLICAFVTAGNDYQKEREFLKLSEVAEETKRVNCWRNSKILDLHQNYLLVGDIIQINEGMEIPADAILLQANEITTDESAMTGEIDPILKSTFQICARKKKQLEQSGQKNLADKHQVPSPILMSGTKVLTGQGKAMIIVVGDLSCIGKIRALLDQDEAVPTPLQMKLEKIAEDIGKFGLISAIIILVVLLIRFTIERATQKTFIVGKHLPELLDFLMLAITVVVVAIPEGLPLAVTLSLAFSVKKMLEDQNLVRKMEACQTMGGANNICSDKTGTLTLNKMTLTQIWNHKVYQIDTNASTQNLDDFSKNKDFQELFKIGSAVCGTATIRPIEKGSSTQLALLKYMESAGVNYESEREKYVAKMKYPFSSARKRMSVIIDYNESNYIFIKGASEMVMKTCNEWYNQQTDTIEPIDDKMKDNMEKVITEMAQGSLRTLCIAYKKLKATDNLDTKDQKGVFEVQKSDLILIAIVGIQDIPRPQVPEAIRNCHKAGITVRMVTGDNIITAKAIAKKVGIIKEGDTQSLVMEGAEFIKRIGGVICKQHRRGICNECAKDAKHAQKMGLKHIRVDTIENAQAFDVIKDKLLVLARSRPEDKYALVTGLRERGQIVAVTGDGTNDAPALKKADVGFAMGIVGTEVAKQAAAIMLMDDNFSSIVKAVLWGRNIYDSIKKFLQFQLTVNVVAVGITLVGAAFIKHQILKPIQMLWLNLIMDTLGSLALATQPPHISLLDRKPHSRQEYIISRTMFKHIIGQSTFMLIVLGILVFAGDLFIPEYQDAMDMGIFNGKPSLKWHDGVVGGTVRSGRWRTIDGTSDYQAIYDQHMVYSRHFTFIFNTFVMLCVFNFINCRKLHEELNVFAELTNNYLFIGIVVCIFILQVLLVTFTGMAFGVYSNFGLHPIQWIISICIGSLSLLVSFILKLLPFGRDAEDQDKHGFGNKMADPRRKSLLSAKRISQKMNRELQHNHPLQ